MIPKFVHTKAAVFAVITAVLLISSGHAEWGKQQINEALKRAEQMKKTIMIPEPLKKVSLKEIQQDCNCTKEQTVQALKPAFKKANPEKLYLLVSSSVAMSTLQAYAKQIQNPNHKNTVMVLQGFVDGIQKIRPTLDFIRQVRCNDSIDVPFEINPEMFEQYNITRVPAMIWQNEQDSFQITGAIDLDEAKMRFKKAENQY
jgi:hypothetical protein